MPHLRLRRAALPLATALAGLSALAPGHALAGTFNDLGVYRFDEAAVVTDGFESLDGGSFRNKKGTDALEGSAWVTVNAVQNFATLPVALPKKAGRYVARLWVRGGRIYGVLGAEYTDGSPGEVSSALFPTGRVTSDGWYEVATAPFSFDASKPSSAALAMIASGADIDALEIVPDGSYRAPTTCSIARDNVCGEGEYCASGLCRDGAGSVPPLPEASERAQVAEFLAGRLRVFFGGRATRANTMPAALASLEAMKTAKDRFAYWNHFATAIHKLRDWHTTVTGGPMAPGRGAFPICVEEGDADLSHDLVPKDPKYPDVLVAYTGTRLTSGLKGGDRIVAVDGMHPIAWAESLDDVTWDYWHADDPDVHAEAMENFRKFVRRFAKELTIIRCDPATKTCSPPEKLPVSALPTEEPDYPTCDHRIRYHVDGPSEVSHNAGRTITIGRAKEALPGENLYGMIWDSVFLDGSSSNPYAAPMKTLRDNASMVILDHRTGNGGTELAAEYLTKLFRAPASLGYATSFNATVGYWEQYVESLGRAIFANPTAEVDVYEVGASDYRPDLRVALLLARDGSASDWFPLGLSQAGANVRTFGRRTAGAFSSFYQFDYYGGLSWQFASGDFVESNGSTRIGRGVIPDEEILPKQSDLIDGRDTVYERALTWVRSGDK